MYILITVMDHEHAKIWIYLKKKKVELYSLSNPMFQSQSFKWRLYFLFILIKHLFTGILSRSYFIVKSIVPMIKYEIAISVRSKCIFLDKARLLCISCIQMYHNELLLI